MDRSRKGGILLPCVALALAWPGAGGSEAQDVRPAAGWPQWLGPYRDGTAPGDPPSQWPERLALRWTASAGLGASSPVVAGKLVFVQGRFGRDETVVALDLETGGERWRWKQPLTAKLHGEAEEFAPASTPAFQGGTLFVHSVNNAVIGLDAETGRERWKRDLRAEFGKSGPPYGPAASPLLADGAVVLPIGDRQAGTVMAFDAATGKTVWESGKAPPGYGSALAAKLAGREQLLVFGISQLVGLVKKDRAYEAAWEYPFRAGDGNQSTPAMLGPDALVITHEQETHALRVSSRDAAGMPEVLWKSEWNGNMATPHVHAGRVYLHSQNELHCLSGENGEELGALELRGDYCSLVRLGDALLCLSQEGKLVVVDVARREMTKLAEYTVTDGMTCSHLAVAGSNLIVRGRGVVRCYTWETASDWPQWRGPTRQVFFMAAYRPRWTGDAFEFQEAWRSKELSRRYRLPSPVIVNKTVYWREDEILYSVDASTGALRWKESLFRSKHWPITSPIWAGGKIFHVTEQGVLRILRDRGGRVEVLLTQKVCCEKGATNASPIVADGKLLLRDSEALYCYELRPDTAVKK